LRDINLHTYIHTYININRKTASFTIVQQ